MEVSASLSAVRLAQGWAKHGEIFSSVKPWVAIVTRAKQATCCQGCFRPGACPDPDIGLRLAPSLVFPLELETNVAKDYAKFYKKDPLQGVQGVGRKHY